MTIGIDKIGFATSQYVLRLSELVAARNTDPEKLSKGLLLKELSIAPITEDIVTLGASASHSILTEEEKEETPQPNTYDSVCKVSKFEQTS